MTDPMQRDLVALARYLAAHNIPLTIGGGYGLYLRDDYLRRTQPRTRFERVPASRSTSDIDIVLTADLIADSEKTAIIREALDAIGYVPVEGAEYYQFVRREDAERGYREGMKFDLLAQVPPDLSRMKVDDRRIRPHGFKKLHAHTTREALTISEYPLIVEISDEAGTVQVRVPHPYSQMVLKLFALRDRLYDETKQFGKHHAYDIYRCLAMMTYEEWDQAREIRERYEIDPTMREAKQIALELLGIKSALGVLRLREHARDVGEPLSDEDIDTILADLADLFSLPM
jgi:hypothetical protein